MPELPKYQENNPKKTSIDEIKENIKDNEAEMDKAVKSGNRQKFDQTCDKHELYSEQYNLQKQSDKSPF